jgi:transcriptional regulator with XRE-family HTH domain
MTSTTGSPVPDSIAERHWICARRLRERRRQLGLTQADVAVRLRARGAVLTNRTVSAMESGRGLDLGRLPDLAAALDCSVTYLIGLTADPSRWEPDTPFATAPDPDLAAGSPRPSPPDEPSRPSRSAEPHHNWILGPDPPSWSRPAGA